MDGSLLPQGLNLMLFGMLTVFLFLSLLVLATRALSALVGRLAPPARSAAPASSARGAAPPSPAVVAAMTAALVRHRQGSARREEHH